MQSSLTSSPKPILDRFGRDLPLASNLPSRELLGVKQVVDVFDRDAEPLSCAASGHHLRLSSHLAVPFFSRIVVVLVVVLVLECNIKRWLQHLHADNFSFLF